MHRSLHGYNVKTYELANNYSVNFSLAFETERYARLKLTKEYIDTITTEGRRRLGDAYPSSDFSRCVEWVESYLKENDPGTWELAKFEIPDTRWTLWGGQCKNSSMNISALQRIFADFIISGSQVKIKRIP